MRLLIALALLAPAPTFAAPAGTAAMTCSAPVSALDTAAKLKARFGAQARIEEVHAAEGEMIQAMVLYPNDKARRLEVIFFDEKMRHPSSVRLAGDKPSWTIAGLKLGDSMARVEALNGKPFTLQGFDWDYGGYVIDLKQGRLNKLPGGCGVSIRLEPSATNVPNGVSGDMELSSTMAKVRAAKPVISELSLEFAAPKGL